jgi:hypothetical protein
MGIVTLPSVGNETFELTVAGLTDPGPILVGVVAEPAPPLTNRVWDTQAGPGFVRWDTTDPDPGGASYPGPGTYGVHTSDYCVEYREPASSIATEPCEASHVELVSDVDTIAAFTGHGNATDLAGNHVLDGGTPAYISNGSYEGNLDVFQFNGSNRLFTTNDSAHRIPVATDVSFGGFFFVNATGSGVTPFFILSSNAGAVDPNYALLLQTGTIKYQSSGGLYDTGYPHPLNVWFHLAAVSHTNRTDSTVYVNGKAVWNDPATVAGTVTGTQELYIGNASPAGAGDLSGRGSDIFVVDRELSAAEVRTYAENAFGHPLA